MRENESERESERVSVRVREREISENYKFLSLATPIEEKSKIVIIELSLNIALSSSKVVIIQRQWYPEQDSLTSYLPLISPLLLFKKWSSPLLFLSRFLDILLSALINLLLAPLLAMVLPSLSGTTFPTPVFPLLPLLLTPTPTISSSLSLSMAPPFLFSMSILLLSAPPDDYRSSTLFIIDPKQARLQASSSLSPLTSLISNVSTLFVALFISVSSPISLFFFPTQLLCAGCWGSALPQAKKR